MSTLCVGPPPLPPNKKPMTLMNTIPLFNNTYSNLNYNTTTSEMKIQKNHAAAKMTSHTYQSFRDSTEDEILLMLEAENQQNNNTYCTKRCDCRRSFNRKKCTHTINKKCRKTSVDDNSIEMRTLVFNDKPRCLKKYKNFENIDQQLFDNDEIISNGGGTLKRCQYDNDLLSTPKRCLRHTRSTCSRKMNALTTNSLVRGVKLRNSINGGGSSVDRATNMSERRSFFGSLTRSHSDGNLAKKQNDITAPTTFNKCLKALSGSWKNLLHLGGMSRPPKPAPTAKKVAPPAVPHEFRHSGSSFGSAGYASSEDGVFITTNDAAGIPRDDHSDYGSTVSGVSSGKSPGPCSGVLGGGYVGGGAPPSAFPFPGVPGQVLSHKAAVYYHHQLSLQEDQGIDMTQSPGRDSPGSSSGSAGSGSRHSTASLDSGRASSYHPLSSLGMGPGSRCGPGTTASGGSPRCSLSSCSIGSEGKIERLIAQGIPDPDIIHAWLQELHYEEYSHLFINAGYDLPTIGRMTPEDLTAIGIKKPNHRKRLKAEIAQLNLPDNLPDYIPGSLEEWLRLLRLEEYAPALHAQGYRSVEDVTQLTWEDLEDIGIVKLGHQKKIMLAIKRVKDIRAGKRFHAMPPPSSLDVVQNQDNILITSPLIHAPPPSQQQQQQQQSLNAADMLGSDVTDAQPPPVHTTFRAFHQQWEVDQTRQMTASCYPVLNQQIYYQPIYCTDIVPIKIRGGRGKSLESLEDPSERSTHHTFSAENTQTFYYQPAMGSWRPRSYDDGDITPTNEVAALMYDGGGGTLPRPRGLVRPLRPVAKITPATKCRGDQQQHIFHDFDNTKCFTGGQYKSLPRDFMEKYHQFSIKKMPPSPPKRQSSNPTIESSCEQQTTVEIHAQSSPLPLPAYPSSDSLSISLESGGDLPLPPPPAPATPPGNSGVNCGGNGPHRLLPSKSWGSSGEEQELIAALALQHRNGSDASFKSSSSTESDSLPFANENAGTIKTRTAASNVLQQRPPSRAGSMPPHSSPLTVLTSQHTNSTTAVASPHHTSNLQQQAASNNSCCSSPRPRSQPADVLNDIGNMLANLTDELDAMLEEEKRQGLADVQ